MDEKQGTGVQEDRLRIWQRGPKWRRWLVIAGMFLGGWTLLFGGWIGVALLRGATDRDAGAVAFNIVLVFFMATCMFLALHRALYRQFWHQDRKRAADGMHPVDTAFPSKTAWALPPPAVHWPWGLRLRHGVLRVIGMATLLHVFLPFGNQVAISGFLARHSAGWASAGSLATLLFAWVPLVLLLLLSMLLLSRQMRRRDAGLLDEEGKRLLQAETNWLFSFAAAFAMTVLLCCVFGAMVVRYL